MSKFNSNNLISELTHIQQETIGVLYLLNICEMNRYFKDIQLDSYISYQIGSFGLCYISCFHCQMIKYMIVRRTCPRPQSSWSSGSDLFMYFIFVRHTFFHINVQLPQTVIPFNTHGHALQCFSISIVKLFCQLEMKN